MTVVMRHVHHLVSRDRLKSKGFFIRRQSGRHRGRASRTGVVNVVAGRRSSSHLRLLVAGSPGADGDVDSLRQQPAAAGGRHRPGRADGSGSQLRAHGAALLLRAARAHEGPG